MENSGRNCNGQFKRGWHGGPGRPKRAAEARYLRALRRGVSLADWKQVVSRALADAKNGDAKARQWLSDYLLGKPAEASEILENADVANQPAPRVVLLDWRNKTPTSMNGEDHAPNN